MNLLASSIVYAGFVLALAALVPVIRPLRVWPFCVRKRSALVFGGAVLAMAVGLLLPVKEEQIPVPRTRLDQFMPVYLFSEIHEREARASCDQVYAAIGAVTPGEIALYRQLTWIRRFGRSGKPGILNAPETTPLLETALHGGFQLLSEVPGQEVVIGVVMAAPRGGSGAQSSAETFKELRTLKAAMNFRVAGAGEGRCRVITETRGYASSPRGRRAFTAYWRVIYPGSALIRRMWLRAIQQRAEGTYAAWGRNAGHSR